MENKNLNDKIEQKALAFEISSVVNTLSPSDARSVWLIVQTLQMKNEELKEQQNQEKN